MKMAENSSSLILTSFQSNCDSTINSNCVEVSDEKKTPPPPPPSNDITTTETDIVTNQPDDEPPPPHETIDNQSVKAQEDALENFLEGSNHEEEDDDDNHLPNPSDDDTIDFKTENTVATCPEKANIFRDDEERQDEEEEEEESKECLNKMQIMEDVREGCSVQPSSPGHAEEPQPSQESAPPHEENGVHNEDSTDKPIKTETTTTTDETTLKEEPVQENGVLREEIDSSHTNEELSNTSSEEVTTPIKRKTEEVDETPAKRIRLEIQENFVSRDKILSQFIEIAECHTVDQMQLHTEQILAEIRTLNDLAKEKEREWNNILHLKKMKEELLLRMQRRKQVALLTDIKAENGDVFQEDSERPKSVNQSILKANLAGGNAKKKMQQRSILPKPGAYQHDANGVDYRAKQRPVLDVQSIIADYRQRHPERVPRRGRRIRNSLHQTAEGKQSGNVLNFASLALGSGSQVHQNMQGIDVNSELGLLLNAIDSNSRPSSAESSAPAITAEQSFKDMLVQLAFSQSDRQEMIQNAIKPPPPYPEVTVHPVPTTTTVAPTNSLLHGILTKSPAKANSKTSFSPTLARLLTAPERNSLHSPGGNPLVNSLSNPNMSISEILSTSKARNEITITPVGNQFETPSHLKPKTNDEEEAEDSADRLVIDESNEVLESRNRVGVGGGGDNSSDAGDEVPQCQGCKEKSALFVCAGCGNQWYCSRDCQVSAWDEHSEVCSG